MKVVKKKIYNLDNQQSFLFNNKTLCYLVNLQSV